MRIIIIRRQEHVTFLTLYTQKNYS
jgi:hypothetical protein